jgi:hypothetical protein
MYLALRHRKELPPDALVTLARNRSPESRFLPSIALFQQPPSWTSCPSAPSDYALLQRARALRQNKFQDAVISEEALPVIRAADYPMAMAAAGLAPHDRHHHGKRLLFWILLAVAVAVLFSQPMDYKLETVSAPTPMRRQRRHTMPSRYPSVFRADDTPPFAYDIAVEQAKEITEHVVPKSKETAGAVVVMGREGVESAVALSQRTADVVVIKGREILESALSFSKETANVILAKSGEGAEWLIATSKESANVIVVKGGEGVEWMIAVSKAIFNVVANNTKNAFVTAMFKLESLTDNVRAFDVRETTQKLSRSVNDQLEKIHSFWKQAFAESVNSMLM